MIGPLLSIVERRLCESTPGICLSDSRIHVFIYVLQVIYTLPEDSSILFFFRRVPYAAQIVKPLEKKCVIFDIVLEYVHKIDLS